VSRPVLMGGLLLVLVVGSIGGLLIYLSLSMGMGGEKSRCTEEEREALSELAHYQEPDHGPRPWGDVCEVRFTTEAGWEEVLGHYEEQLHQHGWEGVKAGNKISDLPADPPERGVILTARRDGYLLWVWYSLPDKTNPYLPDHKALVTVSI
jgi:hypothetical protein